MLLIFKARGPHIFILGMSSSFLICLLYKDISVIKKIFTSYHCLIWASSVTLHDSLVDVDIDALVIVEDELLLDLVVHVFDIGLVLLSEGINLRYVLILDLWYVLIWKFKLNHVEISKATYNSWQVFVLLL